MRVHGSSFAAICVAYLNATCAFAQGVDQHRAEEKIEPYHKHHDTHHGHNHVYPDRGAIFREVPRGTVVVNYAGLSYRFYDGIWFEPQGPAFIVVAPPIGLVVPTLPAFATAVGNGGETYLYANDVYYRTRPDLGGYEVVNDPVETAAPAGSDAAAGAAPPSAPTPAALPLSAASATVTALSAPTAGPVPATPPAPIAPTAPIVPTAPAALTAPTAPSAGPSPLLAAGPRGPKVFAYPRHGQTLEEQARDRYECYRFGVAQSGFDPMRSSGVPPAQTAELQSDFERAQAACFEGRGYTIR